MLTVSESVAAGGREDRSGAALAERLAAAGSSWWSGPSWPMGWCRWPTLSERLCHGFTGLVMTTGGTGFAPSDLTPRVDHVGPGARGPRSCRGHAGRRPSRPSVPGHGRHLRRSGGRQRPGIARRRRGLPGSPGRHPPPRPRAPRRRPPPLSRRGGRPLATRDRRQHGHLVRRPDRGTTRAPRPRSPRRRCGTGSQRRRGPYFSRAADRTSSTRLPVEAVGTRAGGLAGGAEEPDGGHLSRRSSTASGGAGGTLDR